MMMLDMLGLGGKMSASTESGKTQATDFVAA